jgi:hypothetical protein
MPTNLKMLHKNNMLAGMGSVTYATLAKCYRTGGIDSAAWVRGNWGQIKGQKIGDRVRGVGGTFCPYLQDIPVRYVSEYV